MRPSILAATILVVAGCSQRVTPEDEYAARDAAREATPVPAAPAPVAMPAPAAAPAPGDIAVTIEAPAGGAPSGVLFLFVRPVGASGGPPLAVRRIARPSFPLEIGIGPGDAMIPGTRFPDRVTVEARLDQDGDASTTGPEDRSARSEPVALGGAVRLVLEPGEAP